MLEDIRLREDEYELQYYGFSSTELYADIKQEISNAIKTALTQVDKIMKERGCNENMRKHKINKFYTAYNEGTKLSLEKFKTEVQNIFEIPKNVVLNKDWYRTENTKKDVMALIKEVAELQNELIKERVFLAKCKQQKEIIETKLKPIYEKVDSVMKTLSNSLKARNMMIQEKENQKKLIELHEQFVKYYFGSENDHAENLPIVVEKEFFVNENFDGWQ